MSRASAVLGVCGLLAGLACATVPAPATDTPRSCAELAADYQTAVADAQVCDPVATDACAVVRIRRLEDSCHCATSVSPVRVQALDALSARWTAHGCETHGLCNRACRTPVSSCAALPDKTFRCDAP